jgi:hypothetical protein
MVVMDSVRREKWGACYQELIAWWIGGEESKIEARKGLLLLLGQREKEGWGLLGYSFREKEIENEWLMY